MDPSQAWNAKSEAGTFFGNLKNFTELLRNPNFFNCALQHLSNECVHNLSICLCFSYCSKISALLEQRNSEYVHTLKVGNFYEKNVNNFSHINVFAKGRKTLKYSAFF